MCELKRKSKAKSKTGWKVVAEKDGVNHSLWTGIKYGGKIKAPEFIRPLLGGPFISESFKSENAADFKPKMVGKTAIFLNKTSAIKCTQDIDESSFDYIREGYKMVIKKATVTEDIILGTFKGSKVAAGRHIEFLE